MRRLPPRPGALTWLSGVWLLAGVEILVGLWFRSALPWKVDRYGLVALEDVLLAPLVWSAWFVNLVVIVGLWMSYRGQRRRDGAARLTPYLAAAVVLVATALLLAALAPHFEADPWNLRRL